MFHQIYCRNERKFFVYLLKHFIQTYFVDSFVICFLIIIIINEFFSNPYNYDYIQTTQLLNYKLKPLLPNSLLSMIGCNDHNEGQGSGVLNDARSL